MQPTDNMNDGSTQRISNAPLYKARAFAESQELEAGLLAGAHTPVEQALARMAGTLMLAVRTWHWRRVARRKVRAGEAEELAAHANALLRLLERFDKRENSPTAQTSGPTANAQTKPARTPWVKPADCVCQPGQQVMCKPCEVSLRAYMAAAR